MKPSSYPFEEQIPFLEDLICKLPDGFAMVSPAREMTFKEGARVLSRDPNTGESTTYVLDSNIKALVRGASEKAYFAVFTTRSFRGIVEAQDEYIPPAAPQPEIIKPEKQETPKMQTLFLKKPVSESEKSEIPIHEPLEHPKVIQAMHALKGQGVLIKTLEERGQSLKVHDHKNLWVCTDPRANFFCRIFNARSIIVDTLLFLDTIDYFDLNDPKQKFLYWHDILSIHGQFKNTKYPTKKGFPSPINFLVYFPLNTMSKEEVEHLRTLFEILRLPKQTIYQPHYEAIVTRLEKVPTKG